MYYGEVGNVPGNGASVYRTSNTVSGNGKKTENVANNINMLQFSRQQAKLNDLWDNAVMEEPLTNVTDHPPVEYDEGATISEPLTNVTDHPPVYYDEGAAISEPLTNVTDQSPVYYNEKNETGQVSFCDFRENLAVKAQDSGDKGVTTQEIQDSVNNLKAGEKYEYFEHYSISGENYSQSVVWTRNSDNTLTKQEQLFSEVPEGYNGKTTLETHYAPDGKTKLSEEKTNVIGNTRYVSTEIYKGGKRDSIITNFANAVENVSGDSTTSGAQYVKYLKNNAGQFSSNEISDRNGNTLLTFKDGKFFDKKGVEMDEAAACKIIEHAKNNNTLGNLVQTYSRQNMFGGLW